MSQSATWSWPDAPGPSVAKVLLTPEDHWFAAETCQLHRANVDVVHGPSGAFRSLTFLFSCVLQFFLMHQIVLVYRTDFFCLEIGSLKRWCSLASLLYFKRDLFPNHFWRLATLQDRLASLRRTEAGTTAGFSCHLASMLPLTCSFCVVAYVAMFPSEVYNQ